MQYKKLAKTGEEVSLICLGTMTFGEQNSEKDAHKQLDCAMDYGINFIDTAELYAVPPRKETQGLTEKYVGSWLQERPDRDQLFLATKITGPSRNLKYIRDPLDFSPGQIREALEGNLRRLQTDYVDLYQLHWPERNVNNFGQHDYRHNPDEAWEDNTGEILRTMQDLMDEGKIRYFGVSNETPWGLMRFLEESRKHNLPHCQTIQNPYSLLNRSFEVGLAEIAMREQVDLLAYSPLAFGRLSGKFVDGKGPEEARINLFSDKMRRYNRPEAIEASQRYVEVARDHGLSPAQMALAFINQQPFVGGNIIGATNLEQLKENIESINVSLSHEVVREINTIHQQITNPAP